MLGRLRKQPAALPPGIRPPPEPVKKALRHERPATSGRARLVCLSADGAPLPGAIVLRDLTRDEHGFVIQAADMAIADTKGIVRFPSVPAGTHAFDVFVESRPAGRANITIVDGTQAKGEVHCGRPGHVEILVRRAEGGVAAWARLEVLLDTKREWDNLDHEDVLRLAPRTDHAGRAMLYNLPHGRHIVRATWLGRRIEAPVVVATGSRARLDLELPAPKGWPPIGSR